MRYCVKKVFVVLIVLFSVISISFPQGILKSDTINTSGGKLIITFVGHGTLMFEFKKIAIHIDPWTQLTNYTKLPKADIILITHHHFDHLDTSAIKLISKKSTQVVSTPTVCEILKKCIVMKNGDRKTMMGIEIEAVPAYNTTEGRDKFHPKGRDNGYVLKIADKQIYIAGDTEDIPEMANLKNIDIAFLPMNQPYTMLPEQVVDATKKFRPKILYPYHYGETDVSILEKLLPKEFGVELRVREMK